MSTVGVLYSFSASKLYVGFTSNLSERIKLHNELVTKGFTLNSKNSRIATKAIS